MGNEDWAILNEHLPGKSFYQYVGAMVDSNRGILHIHDSFGNNGEAVRDLDYKPLLMLLGSGKVAVESTQAPLDNTVILTTNIEEMELLEQQLTSSKLLDRIEKIPVNYLLDALGVIESDDVTLSIVDGNSSCLLREPGKNDCKYVVMPMRL